MGVVSRVSGPVVIAEGLEGAKMFDVVRVGQLGLVGEIIRLVEKTATVQVYEDTTGVRPGDPVENTGQALSVELGPGLLKSIYDGVQRPLDVLKKNLGDFITRGFVAPALDETVKWEFTATTQPGSKVTPGTILGTVQETPLILHKIMVPPGVEGTLQSLASGKYTIREEIGAIQTAAGRIPLTLVQRWVVRVPRPVSRKLAPSIPLITGQRVIDTFFPVAKGGAACIPGPFGSGKCVAGDTPVALASGAVVTMEELHAQARQRGTLSVDGADEWIQLNEPIRVFSLTADTIVRSESRTFYKGKSDSLVRVKTRSGRTVRVTPIHRLFTFGPDGALRETEAQHVAPGDYVASVRRLPSPTGTARLRLPRPRLSLQGESIRLPEFMSAELAEFLGLFLSRGYVRSDRTVVFTHSDGSRMQRFRSLARALFGIEGKVETQTDATSSLLLQSRLLVDLIDQLGTGRTAHDQRVPSTVLESDNATLAAFLRGYYLGAGSFYAEEVELRSVNRRLQVELAYSLSRFGVLSSLARRVVDGTESFRLLVRGPANLATWAQVIDGTAPKTLTIMDDVRSPRRITTAATPWEELDGEDYSSSLAGHGGNETFSGIGSAERTGTMTFPSPPKTPTEGGPFPATEADAFRLSPLMEDLFCDEVTEVVTEKEGPYDVYDLSLPDYGSNFVGGAGGILLHNTVTQQQLARWADSDIVVYVGCGERGNEMTEVLATFPNLTDPKSKRPLMERTILIANTSNMPVAAREASVYTGITIAEYYRDMGYDVAVMADSTSRWAEAMREISGRLEEMPGEEGYPAYLGRRVAEFYERAGRVVTVSPEQRTGSVTVVGAVSPPGGDFSEPVSQNTLRVTRVFWALDASLASRRHFPSINWLQSYSLYVGDIEPWYRAELSPDFVALRQRALEVLQKESELQEIVQLVGVDALPEREKGILDVARMLREDYLQQSAFDDVDTYTSIKKQYQMLRSILNFGDREQEAIGAGATVAQLQALPVRTKLSRMKWIPEAEATQQFQAIETEMGQAVRELTAASGSS